MSGKRLGGERVDGGFLVLTESTQGKDLRQEHSCGQMLCLAEVTLSERTAIPGIPGGGDGSIKIVEVPYCPNCEKKPISGTFTITFPGRVDFEMVIDEHK